MDTENTGIVFTNENCIGCNRCIAGCPVPGANIARSIDGKNRIVVDADKCIHCGHCFTVCRHHARQYRDDTESFFADLKNGTPISLAVSPSFYLNYPDSASHILGYLKSLGVQKIYNTSFGADITTWAMIHWITQHPDKSGVAPRCAAITNFLTKYAPYFLDKLIPVHTPLMCLAVYVRRYLGETNKIAYISPCIGQKDEIDASETKGLVQYNVTFKHLLKHLDNISVRNFNSEPDIGDTGMGTIYPFQGGLKDNLDFFLGRSRLTLRPSNTQQTYLSLNTYTDLFDNPISQLIVDPLYCDLGCVSGSGIDHSKFDLKVVLEQFQKIRLTNSDSIKYSENPFSAIISRDRRLELLNKRYSQLKPEDFYREFHEHYEQPFDIPDETYEEIFNSMHKTTPESRQIDCQSCGYRSCRQMVFAIANGYNTISNCVQYEKAENYRLYTTDKLTGLPNNNVYLQTLDTMIKAGSTNGFAVIQINIKNFMLINNRFGFSTGNSILTDFSNHLRHLLGSEDKLFHAGGDNFISIMKKEHVNNFIFQANRLSLPTLEQENSDIRKLSIRCGVYELDGTESDHETINNRLDAAYMITKTHKNTDTAFYDESVSTEMLDSIILSQQIPRALENDEFFVVYQPKVRIADHTLIGAEALIRWNHEDAVIKPDNFIPLCESIGLVKRIDFFVLNSVCHKISEWLKAGIQPVKVSVNFSKLHFLQSDIAMRICNIIDLNKVPHDLIEVEITETSYTDIKDNLHTAIDTLNRNNISSSIDDFGTGYSSLSLLQNLKFNTIKLDKSLIDTMMPDVRAQKVVQNIIHMAKDLNMDVVAEGVEHPDELSLLSDLKCDMIQGFIFDKPLSDADFEQRLRNKKYN